MRLAVRDALAEKYPSIDASRFYVDGLGWDRPADPQNPLDQAQEPPRGNQGLSGREAVGKRRVGSAPGTSDRRHAGKATNGLHTNGASHLSPSHPAPAVFCDDNRKSLDGRTRARRTKTDAALPPAARRLGPRCASRHFSVLRAEIPPGREWPWASSASSSAWGCGGA